MTIQNNSSNVIMIKTNHAHSHSRKTAHCYKNESTSFYFQTIESHDPSHSGPKDALILTNHTNITSSLQKNDSNVNIIVDGNNCHCKQIELKKDDERIDPIPFHQLQNTKIDFPKMMTKLNLRSFDVMPTTRDILESTVFNTKLLHWENKSPAPLHITNLIYQGSYSSVYCCIDRSNTRKMYTIKSLRMDRFRKKNRIHHVQRELAIHSRLCHINIVSLLGVFMDTYQNDCLNLVLEYAHGSDLHEYWNAHFDPNKRSLSSLLSIMNRGAKHLTQICRALDYLHSHDVFHRDIKPENILVFNRCNNDDILLKLCDFGFSIHIDKHDTNQSNYKRLTLVGTPLYIALDLVKYTPLSYKNQTCDPTQRPSCEYDVRYIDQWSVGVMAYEMITGVHPFEHEEDTTLLARQRGYLNYNESVFDRIRNMASRGSFIKKSDFQMESELNDAFERKEVKSFCDFVKQMTNIKACARPSFSEVTEHNWFRLFGQTKTHHL